MPEFSNTLPILVADIGGTNARFGCLDAVSGEWFGLWIAPVRDFPSIYSAIDAAQRELPEAANAQAVCLAIAAPVQNDWVKVSNGEWAFSRRELQSRFGWPKLEVVNDFLAAAYGAVTLVPEQYFRIGASSAPVGGPSRGSAGLASAVIGPGTGLGVAALYPNVLASDQDLGGCLTWSAIPTEGGHARFAPFDDEEVAVLQVLQRQLGNVQREDILSGRGLCNLYRACAEVHGQQVAPVGDPAEVTAAALADGHSFSAQVLDRFCGILGTAAADVALDLGTRGTVYLAGGILPRIADFLAASSFRSRFENHLQFSHYLLDIDTVLITEARLGLLGAAYQLRKRLTSC
ncbi:glucokinase [Proteobacteria bacterium 005FR1]|nr:glucokinase [Proteobacteria bacterium 005FR1]